MIKVIQLDLGGVNSYLLESEEKFVLVDVGGPMFMDKQYVDRRKLLEERLDENGVTEANLSLVLLTHGDVDHCFNAAYICEKYHKEVALDVADKEMVCHPTVEQFMENCHYKSGIFNVVMKMIHQKVIRLVQKYVEEFIPFTPGYTCEDEFLLKKFGFSARIIKTPGHTKGSIGVLTDEGDFICGDTFANMNKPQLAPNALDYQELKKTVNMLKEYRIKTIYPGHGEPFEAKKWNK